jgi:MFS superfamily sulfate permease-like transporter
VLSKESVVSSHAAYKPELKADLVSGFLVFLIALPLCLGIAMASSFPPVAGVITAVVGGLIATFAGSAELTIKGPAAGLIVIALGSVQELGEGDPVAGYHRTIAVVVVAGAIQIILSRIRAGELGDFFPSSVVHGMLAAIGVIIISKQAHTTLGVAPTARDPLHLLAEIPRSLANMNPEVALIGLISLTLLFGIPKLPFAWAKKVPAPMVVLLIAVPLGMYLDLSHEHTYDFHFHHYKVGPQYLVQLPGSLAKALSFPDFSHLLTAASIKYIIMFTLVGSLESLLSAKAVDSLDPQRRHSDLNRDLLATGVGNVVAGLLGGLPMISEIVRSSANINSGAKSRYANFFHGLFLLLMVALLPGLLQRIPLAALGAMLIYTGFRLASPHEFVRAFHIGREQLLLFVTTLMITLATDLLVGVGAGVVLKVLLHLRNGAPLRGLFGSRIEQESIDATTLRMKVYDSAVFTNYLSLRRRLDAVPPTVQRLVLDLSSTRLVDHTVIEKLHHTAEDWQRAGRTFELIGLDDHTPLAAHQMSARRKPAVAHS